MLTFVTEASKWKVWKAALAAAVIDMIFGGVELLLVLTLRVNYFQMPRSMHPMLTPFLKGPQERGVEWPMTLIGIIAAILLAAGLLPPYFELWQRKGRVVGISTSTFSGLSFQEAFQKSNVVSTRLRLSNRRHPWRVLFANGTG